MRIRLTQGKFALIDKADASLVAAYKWSATCRNGAWYARANVWIDGKRTTRYLHQIILGYVSGKDIDHVNGNGLDNRRPNIRHCTRSQNRRNQHRAAFGKRSRHVGVYWHARDKKWSSSYCGKWLGNFGLEREALAAYRKERGVPR